MIAVLKMEYFSNIGRIKHNGEINKIILVAAMDILEI